MKIDTILWLILPLLGAIAVVAVLLRPKVKSSKKGIIVGMIIGVAIVVLYMIWNFFYR